MRNYDHDIGPTARRSRRSIHDGPPPGVHMPGPSWRPFLGAFGLFALLLGLVFGGWLLAAGVIALISTLVGWLVDARQGVPRDGRGRPDRPSREHARRRKSPRRLLTRPVGAHRRRRRPPGAASSSASDGQRRDDRRGVGRAGRLRGARRFRRRPAGAVARRPSGPAGRRVDRGQERRVRRDHVHGTGRQAVHDRLRQRGPRARPTTSRSRTRPGTIVFKGDVFPGVATKIYDVPALPAGSYTFLCIVHPTT